MSNILRKIEDIAHPERRDYYNATADGRRVDAGELGDSRATGPAPTMHGGAGPPARATRAHDNYDGYGPNAGVTTENQNHHLGRSNNGYLQYGKTPGSGPAPTTAGPHQHDMLNRLDPRVDSTADGRPVLANVNAQHSRTADAMDPRVDSRYEGGAPPAGGAGAHAPRGAAHVPADPPYHSGAAGNRHAAPEAGYGAGYDDREYQQTARGHGGAYDRREHQHAGPGGSAPSASGPAAGTNGPHRSNLMNKLDPRVDNTQQQYQQANDYPARDTVRETNYPPDTRRY